MTLPGLFVAGTDTGVGKTVVAAGIVRALASEGRRVGALKPVATGAAQRGQDWVSDDGAALAAAVGQPVPADRIVPLAYAEPLAPCVAARRAGGALTRQHVENATRGALAWWANHADVMVVEGVGGLLCPLAEGSTVADLAVALDYPLVIVARRGLGTLNHSLLTIEAARRRGLRIAGIILNGPEPPTNAAAEATNAQELAGRAEGVAVLADMPHGDPRAAGERLHGLGWYSRCALPRLARPVEATEHAERDH